LRFTSWMLTRLIHQRRRVSVEEVSQMPNQSPEPTPIGHRRSAVAVSVADTARLSFFR
jgi:flagellar biogenesis protein FliO